MASQNVSDETPAEPCACKSACTQKASEKRRGCPCKTKGVHCTAECRCGSKKSHCKNKAAADISPAADGTTAPTRDGNRRDTEEEERRKENAAVKDFIMTLDEEMAKNLAIRSLQRGIGSMELIESLLIMEDEEDNEPGNESRQANSSAAQETGGSDSTGASGSRSTSAVTGAPPEWCKCSNCLSMPRAIENKCCGSRTCVTEQQRFAKLCLDADVLQLCVMNRADIRNDQEDNSTRSFRKAAYRQFILDRHGYLGKGNRKVAPACVVLRIRRQYPSSTGVYMGYREK